MQPENTFCMIHLQKTITKQKQTNKQTKKRGVDFEWSSPITSSFLRKTRLANKTLKIANRKYLLFNTFTKTKTKTKKKSTLKSAIKQTKILEV